MFSATAKAKLKQFFHNVWIALGQMNCMHIRRRDINAMEFYCPRCKGTFWSDQI